MKAKTIQDHAALRDLMSKRAGALRREIGSAMRHANGNGVALANHYLETDDDAVADLETVLDVAELERDSRELRQIEAALARLAEGTYGECADCGEPIAAERLFAQPQALRCVACENRRERVRAVN